MKTPAERQAFWAVDLDRCRRALAAATGEERGCWLDAVQATEHLRYCRYRHCLRQDARPLCPTLGQWTRRGESPGAVEALEG